MARLLVVYGTRPEAIKLAPVVRVLRESDHTIVVCHTGQHPEPGTMTPDISVNVSVPGQSLPELNTRVQKQLYDLLETNRFDFVIVQGDTASAMYAATAAALQNVPVAHIEAGLRTGRFDEPWPEELYRVALSAIADVHFAPTEMAAENLKSEGHDPANIHVVGNTIVDALRERSSEERTSQTVLVTTHRRENLADNFSKMRSLLRQCANSFPAFSFDVLLHPNPVVKNAMRPLDDEPNITLYEPETHAQFVDRLAAAWAVMTDSGGVQEEASILGTPCLVIREVTDRPEIVSAGAAIVVGRDADSAVAALRLLQIPERYTEMQNARLLFGDGKTSQRIVSTLESYL